MRPSNPAARRALSLAPFTSCPGGPESGLPVSSFSRQLSSLPSSRPSSRAARAPRQRSRRSFRAATPRPGTTAPPAPTSTPMPAATPTPATGSTNASVDVGAGGGMVFRDTTSGSSTSTIRVGGTVTWNWASGFHSTTSGACCTGDGLWNSGAMSGGSFSHTFTSAGWTLLLHHPRLADDGDGRRQPVTGDGRRRYASSAIARSSTPRPVKSHTTTASVSAREGAAQYAPSSMARPF